MFDECAMRGFRYRATTESGVVIHVDSGRFRAGARYVLSKDAARTLALDLAEVLTGSRSIGEAMPQDALDKALTEMTARVAAYSEIIDDYRRERDQLRKQPAPPADRLTAQLRSTQKRLAASEADNARLRSAARLMAERWTRISRSVGGGYDEGGA